MKIAFFTGAGISASAGIPIYREEGSTWTNSDLEAKSHSSRYGNHLDELWDEHWGPLSLAMKAAEPTHAHKAIAALEDKHEVTVVTQNIDDLHERAGSSTVYHLHGNMHAKCMRCGSNEIARYQVKAGAPKCSNCDSYKTRPDVVLFGELLQQNVIRSAMTAVVHSDVTIVVGSGLWVSPANFMIMDRLGKKRTIAINRDPFQFEKWFKKEDVHYGLADDLIDEVLESL